MAEPTTETLPPLPVGDATLRDKHLLGLPAGVEHYEVEVLAASRFRNVRWEVTGAEAATRTGLVPAVTAALGIRAVKASARALRLGRAATLVGPWATTAEDAVAVGLPASTTVVWVLDCPVERGEKPWPGGDRDGLKRAFPDGMPVRGEERYLQWLVAVARRLRGAIRTSTGAVLTPDPDAATDLTVLADHWVEPAEVLEVVQRVHAGAYLSEPDADGWRGPSSGVGRDSQGAVGGSPEAGGSGLRAALEEHGVADEDERRRLYAEAAAFDEHMLQNPPPSEGFGVLVDLGVDGMLAVEVAAAEPQLLPPLIAELPWAADGVVAYRVRWEPFSIEEIEAEKPSFEHRVARSRSAPKIQAIAKAVHGLVGGEIADEADFLVHPDDL
ncbi:hypothetical protein [Cellulomonas oligotrophica]|uniref:Uncharacterized protein n=1 Tax=Cellulomonas oligotrophica TaxID=931536 RepID=A0A7Y9FFM5_9CELL|nr:hypothetical protein [Cellulomonas oligotrophica]NYD86354.1 hypothetical protein [Cellulomonas oligotrophica]GIG32755.1 hypothetical protein Col01nite_19140 [Cellulomonas oligotrophica]